MHAFYGILQIFEDACLSVRRAGPCGTHGIVHASIFVRARPPATPTCSRFFSSFFSIWSALA